MIGKNSSDSRSEENQKPLSRSRKLLFYTIILTFPLLLLALVETGLRLFADGDDANDPYVNVSPFTLFTRETVNGTEYARITHQLAYAKRKVRFSVQKPGGTVRIFVLGGSAAAGWPHSKQEIYSTYLEQALQNALPENKVEVINAAAHGFASFRVRPIFDELIQMDPDTIIIYSGNNEFLEKREYPTADAAANWLANRLHTVQWLNSLLAPQKTELPGDELKDISLFFWKKVQRQALDLRQDPVQFENVQTHYRHTMEYMAQKAEKIRIPLFLSTVPVNLRDWLPTVSHNQLTGSELEREWQRRYQLGRRGLLEARYREGLDWMNQAIELEPEHAESHFWLARLLEEDGQLDAALESYSRARDLDYNPFRAISPFNDTLRNLANINPAVSLIDLDQDFIRASENGVPGFDLFLDYVHPNTAGNTLIAESMYAALKTRATLGWAQGLGAFSRQGTDDTIDIDYDDTLDKSIQTRMFGLYSMNHQYDAALNNIDHLLQLRTKNGVTPGLDSLPTKFRKGHSVFEKYQATQRNDILGKASASELRKAQYMLDTYFERWYPYGKF